MYFIRRSRSAKSDQNSAGYADAPEGRHPRRNGLRLGCWKQRRIAGKETLPVTEPAGADGVRSAKRIGTESKTTSLFLEVSLVIFCCCCVMAGGFAAVCN